MRLTEPINFGNGVEIVSIGPFGVGSPVPKFIVMSLQTGTATSFPTIQAAITNSPGTTAADVDGGEQLLGGQGGLLNFPINVEDALSLAGPGTNQWIPIDPRNLAGKYITIELTTAAAENIRGWIGVR